MTSPVGSETPNNPWSSWNEYEKQYVPYQNERIHSVDPLRWTVRTWLQEAWNMKQDLKNRL